MSCPLVLQKTSLSTSDIEFNDFDVEDEQLECTLALDSLPSVSNHEEMLEIKTSICDMSTSIEEPTKEKMRG